MEDTHGVRIKGDVVKWQKCLNPYYNGRYSWSAKGMLSQAALASLNPYYNGRYSWRVKTHISLRTK